MRLRGWPDGLEACQCCNADRADAGYVAKGLCQTCYARERKRGDLRRWTLPDEYRRPADTASIAARRHSNLATRLAGTMGAQHVAELLGVTVEVVTVWHTTGTPEHAAPVIRAELTRLRDEERAREIQSARLKGDDWGTTGKRTGRKRAGPSPGGWG